MIILNVHYGKDFEDVRSVEVDGLILEKQVDGVERSEYEFEVRFESVVV